MDDFDLENLQEFLPVILRDDPECLRLLKQHIIASEAARYAKAKESKKQQEPAQATSRKAKRKRARKSSFKTTESKTSKPTKEEEQSSTPSKKRKASTSSAIKKTALHDEEAKQKQEGDGTERRAGAGTEETTPDQTTTITKRLKRKRNRTHKRPKTTMIQVLRKYEAAKVKFAKERSQWARQISDNILGYIRKYCKKNAPGIFSHLEYTGSFYENLKTGDADEIDIILALDTKDDAHLIIDDKVNLPGYARIKATSKTSKYWNPKPKSKKDDKQKVNFATGEGYIRPQKVRSHFFSLVQKAVNEYKKELTEEQNAKVPTTKEKRSGIDGKKLILKVRDNGPAITLVIDDKSNDMKLSVDLVPAFLFKEKNVDGAHHAEAKHYVAKVPPEELTKKHDLPKQCKREMLWRRSFSRDEKKKMQNLDKEYKSCRRAVVKILKTIVKSDATLAKLSSFHVKTAFLHYNFDEGQAKLDEWSNEKLQERLLGLMEYLLECVKAKRLTNFFIQDLNLLEELSDSNLANIENRLTKLIKNENELRKILFVEPSKLKPSKTSQNLKPKAKKESCTTTSKNRHSSLLLYSDKGPLYSDKGPLNSDEEPLNSDKEPLNSDEEPLNSDEEPVNSDEEPLNSDEGPLYSDEGQLYFDEGPLSSDEEQLYFDEGPLHSDEGPLYSDEGQLYSDEGQLYSD